jgi:hypothetical protein
MYEHIYVYESCNMNNIFFLAYKHVESICDYGVTLWRAIIIEMQLANS